MPKTKTQAKAPKKTPPPPTVQQQPEKPEKESGPLPAARAADVLTAEGQGPGAADRARMMTAMQRTVGNARLSRMLGTTVQAKLTVGAPNDPYEQEADTVSDTVMRMPQPRAAKANTLSRQPEEDKPEEATDSTPQISPAATDETIRRQPEDEESESTAAAEDTASTEAGPDTSIYRQSEDGNKSGSASQTPDVSPEAESYLDSGSSGGQPLSESSRAFVEPRFGQDFSGVRVHTDTAAHAAAQALNARAFTRGSDIYLARGQSPTDRGLLAHELTHVVQQRGTGSKNQSPNLGVQRKIMIAGGRLWYSLWLAREWNEMTPRQRRLFLRRHFRGTRDFDLARRIVEDMAAASDELEFDDERELLREVRKRIGTSRLMRESQRERRVRGRLSEAFGYPNRPPAAGCGPRVNEAAKAYWGPKQGNYHFNLSPLGRKNAYKALTTLFTRQTNPCKRTLIHCDYLISVVHFRAFAESIGRSEFNRRVRDGDIPMVLKWNGFTDLEQSFWRSSRRESLQVVRVSRRADLIIGDHVLLFNHPSYDALIQGVGGVWRLENAILVDRRGGRDLFQGHGYSRPVTELHMKRGMRRQYAKHVKKVRKAIKGLRSRSARRRKKSRQTLSRYTGIRRRGREYRIIGRGFCGTTVDRPVKTPSLSELPGLNDPCNPGRLWPVRRPIESD
jgi:hypothetical protein